jgi:hypothetical protein
MVREQPQARSLPVDQVANKLIRRLPILSERATTCPQDLSPKTVMCLIASPGSRDCHLTRDGSLKVASIFASRGRRRGPSSLTFVVVARGSRSDCVGEDADSRDFDLDRVAGCERVVVGGHEAGAGQ